MDKYGKIAALDTKTSAFFSHYDRPGQGGMVCKHGGRTQKES